MAQYPLEIFIRHLIIKYTHFHLGLRRNSGGSAIAKTDMKNLIFITILSCVLTAHGKEAGPENTVLVQNYYWAKEGKVAEVYAHRLHASEVRESLGLAVGRVLRRIGEDSGQAHVIWECEYVDLEARREDLRKLEQFGVFEAVTAKMGTLIRKFDRAVYRIK